MVVEQTKPRVNSLVSLAHYTTIDVLEKLFQSKELWFSRVSEMNDIEEVLKGKQLIYDYATDETHIGRSLWAIRLWNEELSDRLNAEFLRKSHEDIEDTFISCWSGDDDDFVGAHDNLTMWRAYGDDGKGVAIVLNAQILISSLQGSEVQVLPVYYETPEEFRIRAENFFRDFAINLLSLNFENPLTDEQMRAIVEAFSELCFFLAVTHKHPGFKEEREWRLVWTKNRLHGRELDPYLRSVRIGDKIAEKLCVPISPEHIADYRWVLHEIMVGPSENATVNINGIRQLLRQNNYEHVERMVYQSRIPYRSQR